MRKSNASSSGRDAGKAQWKCKSCKGSDAKRFCNFSDRTHCFKCKLAKRVCHGGDVKPDIPSQRTFAQKQLQQQKTEERHQRQIEKLKKELEHAKQGMVLPQKEEVVEEDEFRKMLKELEEKKRFYEKYDAERLAGVLEQIKALKASKAAAIPEGVQRKRAEQELARRSKQSSATEAALAEAKQQVEELEKKKIEADLHKAEAVAELERIRKLIAVPAAPMLVEDKLWTKGFIECFSLKPRDILDKHGFDEMVQKMEAMHAEFLARQQADAEKAKHLAEARVQVTSDERPAGVSACSTPDAAPPSSQQPVLANAVAAEPAVVDNDVLMDLCGGSDLELAKAAKLIMESDVVAKRRKLCSK